MAIFGPCCQRPEEFKRIPGVPDYVASNLGRVRRDTAGKGTYAGRIIKPVLRPDGHLYVYMPPGNGDRLRNTDKVRPKALFIAVQRLVMAAWSKQPTPDARWKDPRQIIHHNDLNPAHNCDTNLAWRTRAKHLQEHNARRRERDADDTDGREPKVFRVRPEIRVEPDPWE